MPKRKSRGSRKRYSKERPSARGRRRSSRRSKPGGKVVRYSHPHKPGLFKKKVRGSKKVVLRARPKVRGRKAPKVASDAVKAKDWRQLLKQDSEGLRFVKKGRRIRVTDTKGRLVAELPYRKGMAREVKARLRLAGGERRPRDVKRVKLSPGKEWSLLSLDPDRGDFTFWEREVFRSRQGVGIGQPVGTTAWFWGKKGIASTGHELWGAFNKIRPLAWEQVAAKVPDWFRERDASVGVKMTVMDAEGNLHEIATGTQWRLEDMTDPKRGWELLRSMLATALSQAGRRFGYFGNTRVLTVGLELGVMREGASLPVIYGQPVQYGEDDD